MSAPKVTPLVVGASGYIAGVCRQLRIAELVNRLVTWDDTQWKRSPGTLIVALIINILTGRRPLYRVWESFERLDLPTLFDEPVQLADLNDDAFGRALTGSTPRGTRSCWCILWPCVPFIFCL